MSYLIVFDVDSTLIAHEAIEELAEQVGKKAEVAAITEQAMNGEIDFVQSLVSRVATLKGLSEEKLAEIGASFEINPGASALIDRVHQLGGFATAVSGGFMQLLQPLQVKLQLDRVEANDLEIVDGRLTGKVLPPFVDAEAKKQALLRWSEEFNIAIENTIAIGDGANDLLMLEAAGLGVGFNPKQIVSARAQLVLPTSDFSPLIKLLG